MGDCILPASQINVKCYLNQKQIIVQYCLLHLQKTSKDLCLWLVCTFDLEQKILLYAVYDLLLT